MKIPGIFILLWSFIPFYCASLSAQPPIAACTGCLTSPVRIDSFYTPQDGLIYASDYHSQQPEWFSFLVPNGGAPYLSSFGSQGGSLMIPIGMMPGNADSCDFTFPPLVQQSLSGAYCIQFTGLSPSGDSIGQMISDSAVLYLTQAPNYTSAFESGLDSTFCPGRVHPALAITPAQCLSLGNNLTSVSLFKQALTCLHQQIPLAQIRLIMEVNHVLTHSQSDFFSRVTQQDSGGNCTHFNFAIDTLLESQSDSICDFGYLIGSPKGYPAIPNGTDLLSGVVVKQADGRLEKWLGSSLFNFYISDTNGNIRTKEWAKEQLFHRNEAAVKLRYLPGKAVTLQAGDCFTPALGNYRGIDSATFHHNQDTTVLNRPYLVQSGGRKWEDYEFTRRQDVFKTVYDQHHDRFNHHPNFPPYSVKTLLLFCGVYVDSPCPHLNLSAQQLNEQDSLHTDSLLNSFVLTSQQENDFQPALHLSPNPVQAGQLPFFSHPMPGSVFTLYSFTGQQLAVDDNGDQWLDLPLLAPGVYLLHSDGFRPYKLVIY